MGSKKGVTRLGVGELELEGVTNKAEKGNPNLLGMWNQTNHGLSVL
ncbi:MAG: hypothetical protein ACOC8C_00825 [Chloroflexota bacterium]